MFHSVFTRLLQLSCLLVLMTLQLEVGNALEPAAARDEVAAKAVTRYLIKNEIGLTADGLRTMPNSKGTGVFVYHPKSASVKSGDHLFWLVFERRAFALNEPTRRLAPGLPMVSDVSPDQWKSTGLETPFNPAEAGTLVFGE